jgi:hypothetical protein
LSWKLDLPFIAMASSKEEKFGFQEETGFAVELQLA